LPRQRMIRPELWGDEGFLELSLGARLLFVGLISHADDEGRGTAGAISLKTRIFPCDNLTQEKIEAFKVEIAAKVRCVFYQVEGKEYYELTRFLKHQTINRPSPSAIPKHTHGTINEDSVSTHGTINEDSVSTHPELSKEGSKESLERALSARSREEKSSIEIEEAGSSALLGAGPPLPPSDGEAKEWERKVAEMGLMDLLHPANDFSSIGKGPFGG
jgi:hypothetical protein